MTLKNKLLRIRKLLFQPDDKCVKAKNTEISVFLTFFWHDQQGYLLVYFSQTSRPLKLFRPSFKSPSYLKERKLGWN